MNRRASLIEVIVFFDFFLFFSLTIPLESAQAEDPASSTYCKPDKELDQTSARDLAQAYCPTAFKGYNGHPGSKEAQSSCEGSYDSLKKAKLYMCKLTNKAQATASQAQTAVSATTGADWKTVNQQMMQNTQGDLSSIVANSHVLSNLVKSRIVDVEKALQPIIDYYPRAQKMNQWITSDTEATSNELVTLDGKLKDWKDRIDASQADFQRSLDSVTSQAKQ